MLGLLVSTEAMSANTLGLWASTLDSLENTGETKMNIVVKSDYIVEKWDCIAVMTANIAGKMVVKETCIGRGNEIGGRRQ